MGFMGLLTLKMKMLLYCGLSYIIQRIKNGSV
jgi:hypothetical protein